MKTLNFLYQETQIHFLINGTDQNVMVNATEMAKMYERRIDFFLKSESTKRFIQALEKRNEFPPYGVNSESKSDYNIIETRGQNGTFMCEPLALKFAAWLDVEFELWVYTCIQEILFGNYKKHWEAHARQEQAKAEMQILKQQIITEPTSETVVAYFEAEKKAHKAKNDKSKAIANQLKLFPELEQ